MNSREIVLTHYDYDKNETVEDGVISVHVVAKSITNDNMAQLLDNHLNSFNDQYRNGQSVGKKLHGTHPSCQGNVGRWALGVLVGLGEEHYTDARNEKIVALGKELKRMIEKGELDMGYMI